MLSGGKVVIFITGLLQYLAKNMDLLVQKILGELFFVKALVARPLPKKASFRPPSSKKKYAV